MSDLSEIALLSVEHADSAPVVVLWLRRQGPLSDAEKAAVESFARSRQALVFVWLGERLLEPSPMAVFVHTEAAERHCAHWGGGESVLPWTNCWGDVLTGFPGDDGGDIQMTPAQGGDYWVAYSDYLTSMPASVTPAASVEAALACSELRAVADSACVP